jgi:hypothetical protein
MIVQGDTSLSVDVIHHINVFFNMGGYMGYTSSQF